MTLIEKLVVLNEFIGRQFIPRYEDLRVMNCGKEYQLISIDSEDDGEIFITLRNPNSGKQHITSLKVYNPATHRTSYDRELISSIFKALGRKRIKEAKEASDFFN